MMNARIQALFLIIAVTLVLGGQFGCRLWEFGAEHGTLGSSQAENPANGARVNFQIVMPAQSLKGNGSRSVRSTEGGVLVGRPLSGGEMRVRASVGVVPTVTFRLFVIHSGNSGPVFDVVTKVVEVAGDGSAQTSFSNVPMSPIIAEMEITGGSIQGQTMFHGAADLHEGDNQVVISPKGSNLTADFVANSVFAVLSDQDLRAIITPHLVSDIENQGVPFVLPALQGCSGEVLRQAFQNVVPASTSILLGKNSDGTAMLGNGRASWNVQAGGFWQGTAFSGGAVFDRLNRPGFSENPLVSWVSPDGKKSGCAWVNPLDGSRAAFCIVDGFCAKAIALSDGSVLIGGTLDGRPMVALWDGTTDSLLPSGTQFGSPPQGFKWFQGFSDFSLNPAFSQPQTTYLEQCVLDGTQRILCVAQEPASGTGVLFRLDPVTGAATRLGIIHGDVTIPGPVLPPISVEEPAINAQLNSLHESMTNQNIEGILALFLPSVREQYRKYLAEKVDVLPILSQALLDARTSFMTQVNDDPNRRYAEITVTLSGVEYVISFVKVDGSWFIQRL